MGATGYKISGLLGGAALASGHVHPLNMFLVSLAGLFVISLVSNATPFFGASYTVVAAAELIAFGFSVDGFILVVLITAAGAAIGKLVIYGGAEAFKGRLSKNRNVRLLARWLQDRRFLLAVFVSGVIPLLPLDDYVYIGAGAAKTRLTPMLSVTVAAKLIKSAFEIELEFFGILRIANFARHVLRISLLDFSILLTVAFIAIGIFLFEYDWGKFLGQARTNPDNPTTISRTGEVQSVVSVFGEYGFGDLPEVIRPIQPMKSLTREDQPRF